MLIGRSQRKCSKASLRSCIAMRDTWLVSMACSCSPAEEQSKLASVTRSFTASTRDRRTLPCTRRASSMAASCCCCCGVRAPDRGARKKGVQVQGSGDVVDESGWANAIYALVHASAATSARARPSCRQAAGRACRAAAQRAQHANQPAITGRPPNPSLRRAGARQSYKAQSGATNWQRLACVRHTTGNTQARGGRAATGRQRVSSHGAAAADRGGARSGMGASSQRSVWRQAGPIPGAAAGHRRGRARDNTCGPSRRAWLQHSGRNAGQAKWAR